MKKYYFSSSKKSTASKSYNEINRFLKVYPESDQFPISNSSFGKLYQDSIVIKSMLNLPIDAIEDTNKFTEEKSRKVKGLKLIIIPSNEKYKIQYIEDSLEKGEFKVIPFLDMFFNVEYNGNSIKIKYFGKDITIVGKDKKVKKNNLYYDNSVSYYEEKIGPKNIIEGFTYLDNDKNYKLYIFKFLCEIDGLFLVKKNICSFDYKSQVIYSCKKNDFAKLFNIPKDSIIIYEIKSGDDLQNLMMQIIKKCYFLAKFFDCFPLYKQKEIFIIGFNRYKKFGYINLDLIQEKNITCLLFDIYNELFGEKIYCNFEDINMLKFLKDKTSNMANDIKEVKDKTNNLENEIKDIKSKLDLIFERLPALSINNNNNQG